MDFSTDQSDSGLMTPFRDASTRALVVAFLEERIGDAVVTEALVAAADRHHVDPALIVAVSWQESRFRSDAAGRNTNKSIDRGLMQLNSSTFTFLSEEDLNYWHSNFRL